MQVARNTQAKTPPFEETPKQKPTGPGNRDGIQAYFWIQTVPRCEDLKPHFRKSRFIKGDNVLTNSNEGPNALNTTLTVFYGIVNNA